MIRDLRFAIRMSMKQPGFSLITVLTLGLGIGATAAVLSLIQGVLLTPPPYREPDRLVLIPPVRTDGRTVGQGRGWAAAQWMEWRKEAKSFDSIAAYGWTFSFIVRNASAGESGSESIEGMWVTSDYFRVLGLRPVLGRSFLESETGSNAAPVIILGYELWQRKFNGDPNILGKTVRLSRRETPPRVVGVMPPGVRFLPSPNAAREPNYNVNGLVDYWTPAAVDPARLRQPLWDVVGRLRAGVGPAAAQSELAVIARRQAQAERDFEGVEPRLQPLGEEMNRDGRRIVLPLLGAAALVLLIACGNAAALLLVRGLQRQQEYAVRTAMGVSRAALFRQVSVESLLPALAGGPFGAALAAGLVKAFKAIGGHAIPRLDAVTTCWPVLAWGLGSAMPAALLAGLYPAFRASTLDPADALKAASPKSSTGRGERRLLRAVTMAQTAFTLALLVGAGLLIRTMVNLSKVQSGYSTDHILTMTVTSVEGDWNDFHRRALDRVSALPGIRNAAFAWGVPLTGNSWPATVEIEGQPAAARVSDRISIPLRSVTPGYFTLLGLSISEGRDFRSTDAKGAPAVAVVNRAFAVRYFGSGDPTGRKLWLEGRDKPATEIVGMVTDGRTEGIAKAAEPEIYLSMWQAGPYSKHLLVRTAADPLAVAASVQRELRLVNPAVAVENVQTMERIRGDSVASQAFAAELLAGFAVAGSVLTLVGIYGVLSLSVASRRRELAIRSAIGAGEREIRNLVLAEGLRLTAAGVVAGVIIALAVSRVLRSFLFGVEPADPATFIAVGLLFALVALAACWAPGRRAAKVSPIEALRCD